MKPIRLAAAGRLPFGVLALLLLLAPLPAGATQDPPQAKEQDRDQGRDQDGSGTPRVTVSLTAIEQFMNDPQLQGAIDEARERWVLRNAIQEAPPQEAPPAEFDRDFMLESLLLPFYEDGREYVREILRRRIRQFTDRSILREDPIPTELDPPPAAKPVPRTEQATDPGSNRRFRFSYGFRF